MSYRDLACEAECKEKYGFFNPKRQICQGKCVKVAPNDNGEDGRPKKEIKIEQDLRQYQYQYQSQIGIETQAPFTFAPLTTKAYSPVFQVHSPQAYAGVGIEQKAESKLDMAFTQAMDLLAKQRAEQTATQEATATISEEEKSAQSLLGTIIVIGALGAAGYVGYKALSKEKKKSKGGKKNA